LSPCHPVTLSTYLLLALSLGALGAINTWDLPAYFLLVAGALLIAAWRCRRIAGLVGAVVAASAVIVAAVAAYWPFYAHYQSQVGRGEGFLSGRYLGWVRAASPLSAWLTVWGILLLLSLGMVVGLWLATKRAAPLLEDRLEDQPVARPRLAGWPMLFLALIAVLLTLIVLDRPTAAMMTLPLGLALPLAFHRRSAPADNLAALLIVVGAAVVAGTELIYLRDFLDGGDWYRMNTLFKFSVPAWLFLGLACGALLSRLWRGDGQPSVIRLAWRAAAAGLIVAGLLFAPLGIPARVQDRFPERQPPIGTLNGMDYMTVGTLYWPDAEHPIDLAYDYLAVQWLLDHVTGTPVIAEAPAGNYVVAGESLAADYYRAGGLRVASFTGFPTLVGQHQYEQRPAEQVGPRTQLAQELFQTTDLARARELLVELHVDYIYIGALERGLFSAEGLRKFDALTESGDLKAVYRSLQVMIYQALTSE
jgi:YYY domain-containing protein